MGPATRHFKRSTYNPGQNIWHKVEKSNKAGQDFKSLLSNFACFFESDDGDNGDKNHNENMEAVVSRYSSK